MTAQPIAAGKLIVLPVVAGRHSVTMESTDGSGLNTDQLALVPAQLI